MVDKLPSVSNAELEDVGTSRKIFALVACFIAGLTAIIALAATAYVVLIDLALKALP